HWTTLRTSRFEVIRAWERPCALMQFSFVRSRRHTRRQRRYACEGEGSVLAEAVLYDASVVVGREFDALRQDRLDCSLVLRAIPRVVRIGINLDCCAIDVYGKRCRTQSGGVTQIELAEVRRDAHACTVAKNLHALDACPAQSLRVGLRNRGKGWLRRRRYLRGRRSASARHNGRYGDGRHG